ncbi:peptidyl-prolyl cis-trans isomerase [Ammoniphilus sp. YIM 78166]|uniref:peptidyl-prolyl cis-trans isomerase n=1 Tax=Ammoniphilus sp. YIM 78166 TaxID=1644106 RepID=UPI00106F4157|nr:peptidyl-prolyl cis-trans isomerase [Ammoniphilus sp. YIM 78166]
MSDVILVKGKVKHTITLDPGVWIFDDRKKHLEEFFKQDQLEDESLAYQRTMGELWDKELREGATPASENKPMFVEKKDISGDWGILFEPFLNNATPLEGTTHVICHLQSGDFIELPLEKAKKSILCFALDGKPIREDGPVHLLFPDGSNRHEPIRGIEVLEVK